MVFKHYRARIIVLILLLVATTTITTYCFIKLHFQWGILAVVVLLAISIHLFRQFNIINKKLTLFLESVQYNDFTINFPVHGQKDRVTLALNEAFNNVLNTFKKMRAEKEEHLLYLNTVVQHIKVGIISFDSAGKISLFNTAACRLLSTPYLRNLHEIQDYNPKLYNLLLMLKSGQHGLLKIENANATIQLSVLLTELRLRGKKYTLVALNDINPQLQQKEIESWQNLTKVLRHEIMNSIAPVVSNIETLNEIFSEEIHQVNGTIQLSEQSSLDIKNAFNAIERRSKGLLHFVNAYREFTNIPKPEFKTVQLLPFVENIVVLLKKSIEDIKAKVSIKIDPGDLVLSADPELLEMVLINLLKNAIEATNQLDHPEIGIQATLDKLSHPFLLIKDNGPGIDEEAQEKIFIPFYTTKKNGSGIGLSLSRQIMQMHGGQLQVSSGDEGTTFTLRF